MPGFTGLCATLSAAEKCRVYFRNDSGIGNTSIWHSFGTRERGAGNGGVVRAGNGPGPAANGPGPGCNIIPPLASIGTKGDILQFSPPHSPTQPQFTTPVSLSKPT